MTASRTYWILAGLSIATGIVGAIGADRQATTEQVPRTGPETAIFPDLPAGRAVSPDVDLQQVVDTATQGDVIRLLPGTYRGSLSITKALTLVGSADAIIASGGSGSTLSITAEDVNLFGVTIDSSGTRFDTLDAAVRIQHSRRVRVEGITIRNALFGLLTEQSQEISIVGNLIVGIDRGPVGMRGDGIRFWEVTDSVIARNTVRHGRDVVIWYSSRNIIRDNRVSEGRYGTHLMYSHDNLIRGNRYEGNTVGVFVMYSRGVRLEQNLLADAFGAGGMGIGLKESGNIAITGNLFAHDQTGLYIDTSPLQQDEANVVADNVFQFCETGVVFHASQHRNTFRGNTLVDNQLPVRVDGGGNATGTAWEENYFSDYQGYDLDGDGIGDAPYQLNRLSNELTASHPDLQLFHGAATLGLVDAAAELAPLYKPTVVLVDARPRMSPRAWEPSDAD